MSTINNRIQQIIDELYSGNTRGFATTINANYQTIRNIIGERQSIPSSSILEDIINSIDCISANWLLTGKGEIFKTSDNTTADTEMSVYKLKTDYFGTEKQNIPLYEISGAAGLSTLFSNQVQQIPLDYINIPNAPACDGAIFVRGDSMYPILKSGDIVCYKTIYDIENIYYGEMYLLDIDVEGDQYLTFKYVQKSELGKDYVCLVSHNTHHSPKDILKSNIRALALVKVSIRYNTIS